ncbi:Sec-independent protein translocase subunit TatA [Kineococcus sp. SYSU DK004]|uniref:Sec-independent protein translocase subunit TatA n=1 Tax=Kineococcus sp. SYSU DK004 TaxID=3383125 RepID=UPI003D7E1837
MGALKPWHILVLVVVLLLLFGAKRLPDAARGLGRSLRIFKSEVKEMQRDDEEEEATAKETRTIRGTSIDDVRDERRSEVRTDPSRVNGSSHDETSTVRDR